MPQKYDKHSSRNKSVKHNYKIDDIKQGVLSNQSSNCIGMSKSVRRISRRRSNE